MTGFAILLGGEVELTERLARQLKGCRVIAADSGIRHAPSLKLEPELWTGDFDSVGEEMRSRFADVPAKAFPSDKNKTDGEIAIDEARDRGATSILLVGAFGGPRGDHAFLHLAKALTLAEEGLETMVTSGRQEGLPLLPGRPLELDYAPGTLFSVLAFTALSGLTLEGAKWPLVAHEVAFGSSLTLSNEVSGALRASLDGGRAMLIAHIGSEARPR